MAVNSSQKEILIKITADAAKAADEIRRLKDSLREAKYEEQLAKAAGDEHKISLIEKRRALEENSKKLADAKAGMNNFKNAMKETTASTRTFSSSISEKVKALTLANVAMGAITTVIGSMKSALDRSRKAYEDYVGNIGDFPATAKRIADAADNMFSDVAVARVIDIGVKLGLTEKQMEAVTKAAVVFSRVAKVDFGGALKTITDAVASGADEQLRKLGVTVTATGDKQARMADILDQLTKKFGDLTIETSNAAEETEKLKNKSEELDREFGKLTSAIGRGAERTSNFLKGLAVDTVKTFGYMWDGYRVMLGQYRTVVAEKVKEISEAKYAAAKEAWDIAEAASRARVEESISKALKLTDEYLKEQAELKRRYIDEEYAKSERKVDEETLKKKYADESKKRLELIKKSKKEESDLLLILDEQMENLQKAHRKYINDARVAERKSQLASEIHDRKENEKIRIIFEKSSFAKMKADYAKYFDEYKKQNMSASELTRILADDEIAIHRRKAAIIRRGNLEEYRAYQEKVKLINEVRKSIEEEQRSRRLATAEMISSGAQTIALSIAGAKSFEDFQARVAASALNALQSMSFAKVTENTALGLAELARFNFGSAAQYFGAAALWGVLGTGAAIGSAAASASSMESSYSSGGGYGGGSLGGGSSAPSATEQKTENVTNIYLKGRYGLITKKELRAMGKNIAEGKR
jgi:hypothetical protein